MDPKKWGPKFWFSLHTVTFTYPLNPDVEHQERIKNFFNSLEYILPCSICRVNYSKKIRKHPIDSNLKTRKDLVYWLIDIHNMVNLETGKRAWSYQEVLEHYQEIYNKKIELETGNVQNKEIEKQVIYIPLNKSSNKKIVLSSALILFLVVFVILLMVMTFYGNKS